MRVQRIERLQRIIVIQGVSLVRILNHPSLDRLVGRDSKYPLTQSVGRENLSGCHLAPRGLRPLGARWHPSRFSLPLSFVCGYSRISPFLTLSFGEDLWILTRSPPSITLLYVQDLDLMSCNARLMIHTSFLVRFCTFVRPLCLGHPLPFLGHLPYPL